MFALDGTFAKAGTAFLLAAYLSLTVALVAGILALRSANAKFEKLNRQWVRLGFLLLASGLIARAILGKATWGDLLAWDRTETWSLLLWLVYGAVLHMNYTPAFKGRKAVWASILAWGFMVLTFFGMDVFLT